MALDPVTRVQSTPAGAQDAAQGAAPPQPSPIQDAERARRGQPNDQVQFSQEGRDRATQAQNDDQGARQVTEARVEFDRRQQESQALQAQNARSEARREGDGADRDRGRLDVTA